MALLDLLGRRAALRILWELSRTSEPLTFRALQAAADTNPSVLNTRVKELRAAGLVGREPRGYALSEEGDRLLEVILPLHAWAEVGRAAGAARRRKPPPGEASDAASQERGQVGRARRPACPALRSAAHGGRPGAT